MDDGGRPEWHPDLIPRLRQIAMILVFDLGGPLLAYSLLRSAGMSAVVALVISGVLPALGHRHRHRRNVTARAYTLIRCLAR
ncbi:MAG TPA: hypothetical protein VGL33_10415 [Streptosporangiaceae bacterium]